MNDDEAIRFINSLVKNLQVLCHGSVEFKNKVEVIGHLYLNVDSDTKFDYVVNEKVCKNEESSTTFVSNSFHAAPKKTVAERKKELEEELAKLQTEQARNQQLIIDDRRNNDGRRRKFPFDTSPTNQLAFNRQSPMRRDNFPMSSPQRHRDAAPIPKMPRLSFDDIPSYDMNAINSSSASHQPSSSAERSDNVYMPSTSLSSSTDKSETQDTKADIKIDLTSIKQEYISQLDTDNESSCVFDRDKMAADQSSSQLYGSSSNVPPSDINLLSSSPNYSQSNQNFNIRSSIDQSPRHSPGASSLGSPRGSTFVQSPPSMSQGSTQEGNITTSGRMFPRKADKSQTQIYCDCGKMFRTYSGYADHKRSHDGNFRYTCPICSKGCNNKQQFIGHMNNHSNNKPFKCERCLKEFTFKHNLVRHDKTCTAKTNS
ncbi:zinc finger protein 768 isoform X2 [Patella vulgata]|uniref:zinc finger protein 768 isoform X2 n=1 Tax=Patella vulgata TaxID=6465 RepID=UPI0021805CBC|nr:zinc finger protein 768 isoform X2 [Patella vulgata]XP_050398210.1 zinc finger protein 768 isoform X2 [Patella vulgata]